MGVVLVRPQTPSSSRTGLVSVQYPVNLGYLAAYLAGHGVDCSVRDFEVEPVDEAAFLDSLRERAPLLVGFSCMTPHLAHGARLAAAVKERFPRVLTVVGGVHATAVPERTLREHPQFDLVVRGEGEHTLLELVRARRDGTALEQIDGLAYRDGTGVRLTRARRPAPDLDAFPFPDRSLVDPRLYRRGHVSRGFSRTVTNIAEVICSRGCPYRCIFCASRIAHGGGARFRSPGNVIAELERLFAAGVRHVSFLDDTFTLHREFLHPVCGFLRSARVTFDCLSRVSDLDDEKAALLAAGGCRKVSFGIESGSPRVLELLRKGITLRQAEEAFRAVRRAGIRTIEATFLVGAHPDETREDVRMTREAIFRLRPDLMGLFVAIPFPGTELNRLLKQRGLLGEERWEEFTLLFGRPSWQAGLVPMVELQQTVDEVYREFYLRPSTVLRELGRIRSLAELRYALSLAGALLGYLAGPGDAARRRPFAR